MLLATAFILGGCTAQVHVSPANIVENSLTGRGHLTREGQVTVTRRLKVLSSERSIQTALSEVSGYKGVPGYRHIDKYSDRELAMAVPDELSILAANEEVVPELAETLERKGYRIKRAIYKNIVIQFPEKGRVALRRHWELVGNVPGVRAVVPRVPMDFFAVTVPNDLVAPMQTYLLAVNAPTAWSYAAIRESTNRIAILDTGVRAHWDLAPRLVPGKDTTGTWSVTYPGGAYSLWPGLGDDTDDRSGIGHGTGMAGIAAAATNNGPDPSGNKYAGAGWGNYIIPMVIMEGRDDYRPQPHGDNAAVAIRWAIDNAQAKVINCSWGTNNPDDPILRDAVIFARDRDIPLVCGSGNFNLNEIAYPAKYAGQYQNVLAVGGVTIPENTRWVEGEAGSHYGPELGLVAPANAIFGTFNKGATSYTSFTGTSPATAIVSGALSSLMYACSALPYRQIRDVLYATADDLGPQGWDQEYGHGLLNFGAAADYLLGSGTVYRRYFPGTPKHAWTTNPAENMGTYEFIGFSLKPAYDAQGSELPVPAGCAPLFRKHDPNTGDRMLSTDPNEASPWYQNEGKLGYYALTQGAAGMSTRLYRLSNYVGYAVHMFTTDVNERNSLVNSGWTDENFVGYVGM